VAVGESYKDLPDAVKEELMLDDEEVPVTKSDLQAATESADQQEVELEEDARGLQRLKQIGIAGSHTVQRMFADLKVSVAPTRDFIDLITMRSVSSQLAVDVVLVAGLFLLLRYGVSRALYFLYHKLDPNRGKVSYKESVFECMQRPLEFLSVFTVGTSIAEAVARPLSATGATKYIRVARELGVILAATWFILRWIERIRSRFSSDGRVDKTQVDSISRLATVVTVVIAILVMMDTIGLKLQSVLAFGGIGGVAIGFAGREIISNFFAGFMLFLTRPFSVGDWIKSIENKDVEGTVEDMGWYMTMIRTWEKRPLYIPNSRFSTFIIENPSRMTNRRIRHEVHIRIEDVDVSQSIVKTIEAMLQKHPDLDPRQHRLSFIDRFDPHSVVIWVSAYTKTVFLSEFRTIQQDLLFQIYAIIRQHGAHLASDLYRNIGAGRTLELTGSVPVDEKETQKDRAMDEAVRSKQEKVGSDQKSEASKKSGNGVPELEATRTKSSKDGTKKSAVPSGQATGNESRNVDKTKDSSDHPTHRQSEVGHDEDKHALNRAREPVRSGEKDANVRRSHESTQGREGTKGQAQPHGEMRIVGESSRKQAAHTEGSSSAKGQKSSSSDTKSGSNGVNSSGEKSSNEATKATPPPKLPVSAQPVASDENPKYAAGEMVIMGENEKPRKDSKGAGQEESKVEAEAQNARTTSGEMHIVGNGAEKREAAPPAEKAKPQDPSQNVKYGEMLIVGEKPSTKPPAGEMRIISGEPKHNKEKHPHKHKTKSSVSGDGNSPEQMKGDFGGI